MPLVSAPELQRFKEAVSHYTTAKANLIATLEQKYGVSLTQDKGPIRCPHCKKKLKVTP